MKEFLTTHEAAAAIGVSERTVRRMLADGELPAIAFRRRRFVPREAIDRVLDKAMAGFDPSVIASPQHLADAGGPSPDAVFPSRRASEVGGSPGSAGQLRRVAAT
jgi:excisionase family DNA binding protein